jgi:hypothetical protein
MRKVLRPLNNVGQASSLSLIRGRQAGSLSHIIARFSVLCSLISVSTGCAPQKPEAPQDKPLAAFRTNLLQTAFDVATAIPMVPHIKDRSKMQEAAATLCLKLDQPQRALGYIEKIGDWRRGSGYADYAFYCAQHGFTNEVQKYLDLAEQISSLADQDWRRDRIRIKISSTHTLLGQTVQADRFQTNIEASESGKVARVEALMSSEDTFASQMKELDALIASGTFDAVKNALYACAGFFDRFYADPVRRAQAEEKIKTSWNPLPLFIRIELLMELADVALGHADQSKALEFVNETQAILDGAAWPAEYIIPTAARLAGYRFRSGEQAAARSAADGLLTFYDQHQSEIINIDKAEVLMAVAEALPLMGDSSAALAVYKKAVEAGVENPNSRPRAEDLSAICLSMAKYAVEPDAALWSRIREIQANFGDPW